MHLASLPVAPQSIATVDTSRLGEIVHGEAPFVNSLQNANRRRPSVDVNLAVWSDKMKDAAGRHERPGGFPVLDR